jgi:hypothetical protein
MGLYEVRSTSESDLEQNQCRESIDMEKDLFLHNQRRALITEEDNETQRFLGFLVRYQQRSPKKRSSLRSKSPRKRRVHKKSSCDD